MVYIRNTRKIITTTVAVFAVSMAVFSAAEFRQIKSEKIPQPEETKIVYQTEYRNSQAYYSTVSVSTADRELLARLVYLEARNQPVVGQRCVVEVVLNRMLDSRFPNTIHEVIYQKNQFSTASYIEKTTPTQAQYDVVDEVLNENYPILDPSTVYFSTFPQTKNIAARINEHYFCR